MLERWDVRCIEIVPSSRPPGRRIFSQLEHLYSEIFIINIYLLSPSPDLFWWREGWRPLWWWWPRCTRTLLSGSWSSWQHSYQHSREYDWAFRLTWVHTGSCPGLWPVCGGWRWWWWWWWCPSCSAVLWCRLSGLTGTSPAVETAGRRLSAIFAISGLVAVDELLGFIMLVHLLTFFLPTLAPSPLHISNCWQICIGW